MKSPRKVETVNSWANTFSRLTGRNFYLHALRHFTATSYVKAGLPDSVIIDIFGWSTADMLKIYDDTGKEEKLSMYFKDGEIDVSGRRGIDEI